MKFDLPNAVAEMNKAVAAVGEDGDSWEIVGDPLSHLVDDVVPAYDDKLDLKLKPSAGDKRAEICTVRWGKIEKDIARLNGLVLAIRNISVVVKSGMGQLAVDWKGEAFDAFRVSIEKVERTLDDYATAMETTAGGMTTALTGIRQLFTSYRDDSLEQHLVFDKFSKPADWKRMSPEDAEFFVENCSSQTVISDCLYNNDQQVAIIDRKLTNKRLYDQLTKWDCTRNPGVVIGQYNYTVDSAYAERKSIQDKIGKWYSATEELERTVGEAFDAALENLRIIAELKVFSTFSVPGATAPGGATGGDPGPSTGGDPGPGGGYPVDGGGYPVDGGEVATPSPEPTPEPVPESDPAAVDPTTADPTTADPAAVAGQETTDPAATQTGETVEIKDGDHTISVSSPDGQGVVKVTVDDGSGTPKSYALDFDAASGLPRSEDALGGAADENVTQVPARTDGKCVIQDGDMTITAERPLFSPDSVNVTVDDGTGSPTTYTLDFPEDAGNDDGSAQADPAAGAQPAAGTSSAPDAAAPGSATSSPEAVQGTPDAGQPVTAQAEQGAQPVNADQTTSPQSSIGDQRGSLSGELRSDQHDGEAGLASAPDATTPQSLGMVGAGLPMTGGAQGGDEGGRAGSGWSVHGDLFDSGEPVYSMHGVLGDDDLESR